MPSASSWKRVSTGMRSARIFFEELLFEGDGFVAGSEGFFFKFFEFFGDVAFGVADGLAAGPGDQELAWRGGCR